MLAVISLTGSIFAAPLKSTTQKPSPPGTAEITLKGKKIAIAYSRPSTKEAAKFSRSLSRSDKSGELVQTRLQAVTETDLTIGGATVPREATHYIRCQEGRWKADHQQTGQWGTEYTPGRDVRSR